MSDLNKYQSVLACYLDPYLGSDLSSLGVVDLLEVDGDGVKVSLIFPYLVKESGESIRTELVDLLKGAGAQHVKLDIDVVIPSAEQKSYVESLASVKNIVAVSSGKGGVGKSTTAANLALAMAAQGAKVGMLDADIYGPSQGMMLGVKPGIRPKPLPGDKMLPVIANDLATMSIAYLVDETSPMVWRGPMASGAIAQMVNQTQWGELDYLFIDMPPGTGDIHLTLAQKVPISAAIVVTTPQDIALLDAKRGIEMFAKVDVPVLGVIENMSVHICSNCGHQEHIFGEGGAQKLVDQYDCTMLGALPLDINIRTQVDCGVPSVIADKEGQVAYAYLDIARRVSAQLYMNNQQVVSGPSLSIIED